MEKKGKNIATIHIGEEIVCMPDFLFRIYVQLQRRHNFLIEYLPYKTRLESPDETHPRCAYLLTPHFDLPLLLNQSSY